MSRSGESRGRMEWIDAWLGGYGSISSSRTSSRWNSHNGRRLNSSEVVDALVGATATLGVSWYILRFLYQRYRSWGDTVPVGENNPKKPIKSSLRWKYSVDYVNINIDSWVLRCSVWMSQWIRRRRRWMRMLLMILQTRDDTTATTSTTTTITTDEEEEDVITVLQGSCHCGSVQFTVQWKHGRNEDEHTLVAVEQGDPPLRYPHLSIPSAMLEFSEHVFKHKHLCKYNTDTDNRDPSMEKGGGSGAHLFCGHCGVHLVYVPDRESPTLSVNALCLHLPQTLTTQQTQTTTLPLQPQQTPWKLQVQPTLLSLRPLPPKLLMEPRDSHNHHTTHNHKNYWDNKETTIKPLISSREKEVYQVYHNNPITQPLPLSLLRDTLVQQEQLLQTLQPQPNAAAIAAPTTTTKPIKKQQTTQRPPMDYSIDSTSTSSSYMEALSSSQESHHEGSDPHNHSHSPPSNHPNPNPTHPKAPAQDWRTKMLSSWTPLAVKVGEPTRMPMPPRRYSSHVRTNSHDAAVAAVSDHRARSDTMESSLTLTTYPTLPTSPLITTPLTENTVPKETTEQLKYYMARHIHQTTITKDNDT